MRNHPPIVGFFQRVYSWFMDEIVVVGGGVAGLLAGNFLWRIGQDFSGSERSESLGSDLIAGHHRCYDGSCLSFWAANEVSLDWKCIEEKASELKKGKLGDVVHDDFSEGQSYFLKTPFYVPAEGYGDAVTQLVQRVGKHFAFKKAVHEIDLERHVLSFMDGSEMGFGKLIWSQSLDSLFKALKGIESDAILKRKKAQQEPEGGLVLDMQFREPFVDKANTIVMPFRFKEDVYRALGNRDSFERGEVRFTWTIFLGEALLENREEVAKCVRTFKREFFKQFPTAAKSLITERIVFLPLIASGTSVEAKSLELFPGIFYLGSQVRVKNSDPSLQNLDLLAENCRKLALEAGFAVTLAAEAPLEMQEAR